MGEEEMYDFESTNTTIDTTSTATTNRFITNKCYSGVKRAIEWLWTRTREQDANKKPSKIKQSMIKARRDQAKRARENEIS